MSHPVLERLASPDPDERRAACLALADDPSAVLLMDALGRALGDPVKAVSRAASDALVKLAHSVRGVDAVVRDALRSDEPRRRFAAAYTHSRLSPPSPTLIPAAVEALASPDGDVRWAAARILVDMGRLHDEVFGVLLGLAAGAEAPLARRMAAFALRELAPDRPESARALLAATRDADVHVRRAAYTALASLLDPPPEVPARLVEALDDAGDTAIPRIAAVALGALGAAHPGLVGEAARARLVRVASESADTDLRRAAERALARLAAA